MYTKPDPTLPEIGARLALTRRALGLTRFQMARLLGTDMPTWGTYEAGLQRIRVDRALKLSAYGIPLEWVYQGKTTNLHRRSVPRFASCKLTGARARRRPSEKLPEAGHVRACRNTK
jgi:transcriptional regulator with XRE-family HTH domain